MNSWLRGFWVSESHEATGFSFYAILALMQCVLATSYMYLSAIGSLGLKYRQYLLELYDYALD
jgi:hypothetical protein